MNPTNPSGFRSQYWGVRPWKRHSLVLTVAGFVYMGIGYTYIFTTPTENLRVALSIALSWFPIQVWGAVFMIVGFLTAISARWPPIAETWGYLLLTALSAGWAATYTMGVIIEHSPINNLSRALTWALLAFLWWAISGFVNPDKTVVVVIKDDGQRTDN